VRQQFSSDFDVTWESGAAPEAACRDSPVAAAELLERFSQGKRFAAAAGAAAVAAGLNRIHCALVFYAARYEGKAGAVQSQLTFLGNFRLSDKLETGAV
jgi:hypothetical protein